MKTKTTFFLNFLLSFLLFASSLHGQQKGLSINGLIGGSTYLGDLVHSDFVPYLSETQLAWGLGLDYSFNSNFYLGLNYQYAGLSGNDETRARIAPDQAVQNRRASFKGNLQKIALGLTWEPLGHKRNPGFKKALSPYLGIGIGYNFFKPHTDYSQGTDKFAPKLKEDQAAQANNSSALSLPISIGFLYDLNKQTRIGLDFGLNLVKSDYIDGISQAGNPDQNDAAWHGGLKIVRTFYSYDKDKDGIPDEEDACPEVFGVSSAQGCPDADGDGVADDYDHCPNTPGLAQLMGCPDADGDGITDAEDHCPQQPGPASTMGCPDSDKDGIADEVELRFGTDPNNPDTDGDGLKDGQENSNHNDKMDAHESNPLDPCDPNNAIGVCDMDGDGIINEKDECPAAKGLLSLNGCPDRDGDKVPDKDDQCPDEKGSKANNGCPEITAEEADVIDFAIQNVHFHTSSAVLKPESRPILQQIADIMKKHPNYHLTIEGHTDSRGDEQMNQVLSENRAKSCFDYLVSQGIDPTRMSYAGYGETQPIATNGTPAGRAQNRRVDFKLELPK